MYTTRVSESYKRQVFCIKLRFGINPTSFESSSKSPFFNYIKPYMVYLRNTQKIQRENIRFTRNNKSKRKFFIKYSQVNVCWLDIFWLWSLSCKITNHFFVWLWIDKIEGNGKKSSLGAFVLRYWVLNSFLSFLL